jgi:tetratricopeptide (TPR) repeat protein
LIYTSPCLTISITKRLVINKTGRKLYDYKKRIELFKKLIAIDGILHENNDYIYEVLRLRAAYYWIAKDYLKLGNYSGALDCIERFSEYSVQFDDMPEVSTYTSVIFHGEECPKDKDFGDYQNAVSGAIRFLTSDKIFEPIRGHERFKAVTAMLEKRVS